MYRKLLEVNEVGLKVLHLVETLSDHVDSGHVFLYVQVGPQIDDQVGQRENSQRVHDHIQQVSFHSVRTPEGGERHSCN